jgi:hypothetical protein
MAKLKPEVILSCAMTAKLHQYLGPECRLAFAAPIQIVSEANGREHWAKKMRRKQEQQRITEVFWRRAVKRNSHAAPYVVHLHRIGPKLLDDDNLAGGFKATRDQIAKLLGVDDGSESIKFIYTQEAINVRQYAIVVALC